MSGQDLPINFAQGLSTKVDPRQIPPQNFLSLENMVFTQGKALGKRNGYAPYSTATINPLTINLSVVPTNITTGRLVTSFNDELILCDGLNLFSYSDSDTSWIYKGRATLASLNQTNINKNINSNTQQDSAQNSTLGWNLFAWIDSVNGLTYNIIDQVSGQVILPAVVLSAFGIKPRCFSNGGNLYIIYYDTGIDELLGVTINSLGSPSRVQVVTDIATDFPNYDVDVYNGNIYLAYYTNHGIPHETKISLLNSSLAATATITVSENAQQCISIFDDPTGNVWVVYGNGSGISAFVVNSTVTATVLSNHTVDAGSTGTNAFNVTGCYSTISSQAYIFYDQNNAPQQGGFLLPAFSSTDVAFSQPSVNSNTGILIFNNINFNSSFIPATIVGTTVFIPGGGFYSVVSEAPELQFTVSSASAATGSVYADDVGNQFTTVSPGFSSATTIFMNGNGLPDIVGLPKTLTKVSGTGDSTITYSAVQPVEAIVLKNLGGPQNAAPSAEVPAYTSGAAFEFDLYATSQYAWTNFNTLTVGGVAGTAALYANEANLASKAWTYLGIPTITIVHAAQLQPTYFISNLYNYLGTPATSLNANLAVKICESEAGGTPAQNILPRVNQQSSTAFQIAFLQQDLLFTSTNVSASSSGIPGVSQVSKVNVYSNFGVVSDVIDFSLSNPSAVVLGQNLHISSGVLLMYDGQNVVEHNFHIYPENVIAFAATNPSSLLSAGQYGYQFLYEWTDNQGQVHRSSPSPVISLPVTSGQAVTFQVPYLTLTQKQGSTLVAYRTQVNGSIYFRLISVPQTQQNILNGNPPVWQFTDIASDASLAANEQIYTTGEVENIGAPPCFSLFAYKNRLILIPYDTPTQFWYSKQVDPGSPVEFSDLFVQNVGSLYGNLTGGARLDDKIILATETALTYVVGDGPAASGANNDFSNNIFITSDAGVVNQQSLIYSPIGLFFKSNKGIYLCGRDLSVSYFGSPVEAFNSQAVVSGQLISNAQQVRFMLSGGTTLMYDYFYGQWGQFTNPSGIGDCIYNGLHTFVNAAGLVSTETPGVYADGATPVTMSFLTANLNLAQMSGYQRIYDFLLLFKQLSACQIQVQAYYDYSASPAQSTIFTPTAYPNQRIHTKRQLCQAIQVGITELASVPGAGFTMSGITYRIEIKKGNKPIPGASAAGLA